MLISSSVNGSVSGVDVINETTDYSTVMPDRFGTTEKDISYGIENANETHLLPNITDGTTDYDASSSVNDSASPGAASLITPSVAAHSYSDYVTHGSRSASSGKAPTQQLVTGETSTFSVELSTGMVTVQNIAPEVPVSRREVPPPSIPSSGSSDMRSDADEASSQTVPSTNQATERTTSFTGTEPSAISVSNENDSSASEVMILKPTRNEVETNKLLSAQFAPIPFIGHSSGQTTSTGTPLLSFKPLLVII